MYKDFRKNLNPRPMFENDEDAQKMLYDVPCQSCDPFYTQDFAKNENGWPASELQIILRNQNESVVNQLLQKIEQRVPDFLASDISFDDAVNTIVPRSIQSYAETERFTAGLVGIAKRLDAQTKLNDSSIKFDESDSAIKDEIDKV